MRADVTNKKLKYHTKGNHSENNHKPRVKANAALVINATLNAYIYSAQAIIFFGQ